jgi:NAD(P)-dependent dehydrogenase (short-subunit alcohol dehydrogenase family)
MFDFTGKVVIVTGAAGNLGSGVAQAFLKSGANLVLVDHSQGKFASLFPDLINSKDHLLEEGVDLTEKEPVNRLADKVYNQFGSIYALVNIAGGYRGGTPVHDTPLETWDFLLNLNARTVFSACQAVIPIMLNQGSGKIINIAARQGLKGGAKMGAYSVSKSAVIRLTESMSAELKAHNINVNCILPGTIDTPENREAMPASDFNRWVSPNDLAEVILFLASPSARAIHGASIPVYGLS